MGMENSVLVYLDCHNKIPQTEHLINDKFISHSPGDQKSRIMVPAWLSKGLLPSCTLVISSWGRRGSVKSPKDTDPIREGFSLMT